jgi:hypothetical protein
MGLTLSARPITSNVLYITRRIYLFQFVSIRHPTCSHKNISRQFAEDSSNDAIISKLSNEGVFHLFSDKAEKSDSLLLLSGLKGE